MHCVQHVQAPIACCYVAAAPAAGTATDGGRVRPAAVITDTVIIARWPLQLSAGGQTGVEGSGADVLGRGIARHLPSAGLSTRPHHRRPATDESLNLGRRPGEGGGMELGLVQIGTDESTDRPFDTMQLDQIVCIEGRFCGITYGVHRKSSHQSSGSRRDPN